MPKGMGKNESGKNDDIPIIPIIHIIIIII